MLRDGIPGRVFRGTVQLMSFDALLSSNGPVLALAPMQDVTDLPFWRLVARYGGPDVYYTEYFRVTQGYSPEKTILRSIIENPTGRPAIAQIIGNDEEWMARTAARLEQFAVVAIDLNLGCPAPVVYRKCAGGGLLRDPERVRSLLRTLRSAVRGAFTVKTRLGFEHPGEFDRLLDVFADSGIDLLTVHGRTVAEKYGPSVHYDKIAQAVARLNVPVLANGNVACPESAIRILSATGARGLMIGRGAIRNPWIFAQIRDRIAGRTAMVPTGRDLLDYVRALYEETCTPGAPEKAQVQKMKKYMNFIGEDVGTDFLHAIRRCGSREEFFGICEAHLDHSEPLVQGRCLVTGGSCS